MRRASLVIAFAFALTLAAGSSAPALANITAGGGYDSAYAGESVFTAIPAGSTGQMSAIFFNSGSQPWAPGVVGLLVCLADKTTCNLASPNAAYASGWYSQTVYATVTSPVSPGQNGFFVYSFAVPNGTPPGTTVTFNGDLGLVASGAVLHPQGYYQQNTAPAATGPYTSAAFDPTVTAADGVSSSALNVALVYPNGQAPAVPPTITVIRTSASALYCRITDVPGGQQATRANDGSAASAVGIVTQFTVTSTTFPGQCDIQVNNNSGVPAVVATLMTKVIGPPTQLGVASGGASTHPAATSGTCTVSGIAFSSNTNASCTVVFVDVEDVAGNRVTADSSRVITATLDPATCSGSTRGDVLISGGDVASTSSSSATVARGRATFVLSSTSPYPGCRITFTAAPLKPASTTEAWTG
jgi:hypothetical protein